MSEIEFLSWVRGTGLSDRSHYLYRRGNHTTGRDLTVGP